MCMATQNYFSLFRRIQSNARTTRKSHNDNDSLHPTFIFVNYINMYNVAFFSRFLWLSNKQEDDSKRKMCIISARIFVIDKNECENDFLEITELSDVI